MYHSMDSTDEGTKLARKYALVVRHFPPGCGPRASDRETGKADEGTKLARKYALVVRHFPPGCGPRASEREPGKVVQRSDIAKRLQQKRHYHSATTGGTEIVVHRLVSSSSREVSGDREKVMESLRLFREICRELSQGIKEKIARVDLKASNILKDQGRYAHAGKQFVGDVPGVEVGDRFYYRIELAVVCLHRPFQAGIDFMTRDGEVIATSIVASSTTDNMNNPNELVYVGEGGLSNHDKLHEDQKLIRGNLGLYNGIQVQNHVRVIRKVKASASDTELITCSQEVFAYDGLYRVHSCQQKRGDHGRLVFEFKLKRVPGQPAIARFRG